MNTRSEKIQAQWDVLSQDWNRFRSDEMVQNIIKAPYDYFRPELQNIFKRFVGDFTGKKVLVIGSGSGRGAFAFHALGADVTACDLSQKQLDYTATVAKQHGFSMEFIQDDVTSLANIAPNTYDLVYIPNGVMFWINDLSGMYSSIRKVLKNGGLYIMYDMHPFMHPFDFGNATELVLKKDYNATGPFGAMETHLWRLQDYLNGIIGAKLNLVHMEEMKAAQGTFWVDEDENISEEALATLYNMETNPLYALPQCLALVAQK